MEIKVKCSCGSVYSFDETPMEGRLAYPVACTNCGVDGTEKANAYIAAKLNGTSLGDPKPAGWFGFRRKQNEFAQLDLDAGKPFVIGGVADDSGDETSPVRLVLAGLGALLAGVAGAYGWLAFAKATGFESGYVAWALGGLVGGVSVLLAPRGHYWLGAVAAVAAFIAISGGELLVTKWVVGMEIDSTVTQSYQEALDYAKDATAATSGYDLRHVVAEYKLVRLVGGSSSDDVITTYQKYQVNDSLLSFLHIIRSNKKIITFAQRGEVSRSDKVADAEIEQFKAKVLPQLKELAGGKPAQPDYQKMLRKVIFSQMTFNDLFVQSIGPYSLLWVFCGIATAYKLARNAGLKY